MKNKEGFASQWTRQVAGKLIADGLTSETFTIEKALVVAEGVVLPKFVKRIITMNTDEVLEEMKKLESC